MYKPFTLKKAKIMFKRQDDETNQKVGGHGKWSEGF